MQKTNHTLYISVFIATFCLVGVLFVSKGAMAATFIVNSTDDSNDGACDSPFVDASVDCTYREAINAANQSTGPDTIAFMIDPSFPNDGAGQWTISLGSATNPLAGSTTVTAAAMWDSVNDRPGIAITQPSGGFAGLTINATAVGTKIQGIEWNNHANAINAGAPFVTIGTDCDGVDDARERNVIRGSQIGINLNNAANAKVKGNYIGLRSDGLTSDPMAIVGIIVRGAASDSIIVGYEEGTSGICPASLQRNVIAGGSQSTYSGILINGLTVNLQGDQTQAPNDVRVSGNFIGVGADGITNTTGLGVGVKIQNASTHNTIGTNGNSIDDAMEGNVISGWDSIGVYVFETGYNRISGNIIGFASDGVTSIENNVNAINARGIGTIIGYCDTSTHATLCFSGGSKTDQGNVIGNSLQDGVRLGASCQQCVVAGNWIGTDKSGLTDAGNGSFGVFVHRGNTDVVIGGTTTEHANTVSFNDQGGILVDGYFSGSTTAAPYFTSGPTESYTITGNTISQNDSRGIWILGTEQDGTIGPSDGVLTLNQIIANAGPGLVVEGSSPSVSGNVITGNSGNAIEVRSAYRRDEPLVGSFQAIAYNHPTDSLSPDGSTYDSVSQPIITGNAIDGNGGGIAIIDADVFSIDTLETDNTIGTNGEFDIKRDWYAAIEIFSEGLPLSQGVNSIVLAPASGACTSVCTGLSFVDSGSGTGVWGPEGIQYTDEKSWFLLTDYMVDSQGARTNFNPYTISVSAQDGLLAANVLATIDGDMGNDTDTGGLPSGIQTASVSRYQIVETTLHSTSGSAFGNESAPQLVVEQYAQGQADAIYEPILHQADRLTLSFVVSNKGNAPSSAQTFRIGLPASFAVQSVSVSFANGRDVPVAFDASYVAVAFGEIQPNDSATIEIYVLIDPQDVKASIFGVLTSDNEEDAIESNEISFRLELSTQYYPAQPNTLIKRASDSAVYLVDDVYNRRVFINEQIYYSWYDNFDQVITLSDEAMKLYLPGQPIPPRPGTWLVKTQTDVVVYAVEPTMVARPIPSEQIAADMFGAAWARRVLDIDETRFHQYERGEPLEENELPDGMLVQKNPSLCYIQQGSCHPVSEAVMLENQFFSRFIWYPRESLLALVPESDPLI